jgi:hypothetical protein
MIRYLGIELILVKKKILDRVESTNEATLVLVN